MTVESIIIIVGLVLALLGLHRTTTSAHYRKLRRDIDEDHTEDVQQADARFDQRLADPDGTIDRAQRSIDGLRRERAERRGGDGGD